MNKYSIIVPVYNVEKYIRECLDSLKNQTYGEFEAVLVDDGSPDGSGAICDEYAARDPRFKVVHKENGGLISAWKEGLRRASNELILFVDSDDYIKPQTLEMLEKHIDFADTDLVQFCALTGNDTCALKSYDIKELYPDIIYYKGFGKIIYNSRCGKVFKRSVLIGLLDDIDGYVEIGEDKQTTFCYLLNIRKAVILDYDGYYYRQNYDSMTHKYNADLFGKTQRLFDSIKRMIAKYGDGFDFSEQICKEKAMYATMIMAHAFMAPDKSERKRAYGLVTDDPEMRKGFEIIDFGDLSLYCRKTICALRDESYFRVVFWQYVRKCKKMLDKAVRKIRREK